jgi:predicted DCC family thiol-disulfide oxidoreductase YuxK
MRKAAHRATRRSERAGQVRRLLGELRALDAWPSLQPSGNARNVMLFDGSCGFCTWIVGKARRLDTRALFAFVPYQFVSDAELDAFGVTRQQCSRSIAAISAAGRLYRGAHAVNALLFACTATRPLAVAIHVFWPLLLTEIGLYRLVARQRTRISAVLGTQKFALLPDGLDNVTRSVAS